MDHRAGGPEARSTALACWRASRKSSIRRPEWTTDTDGLRSSSRHQAMAPASALLAICLPCTSGPNWIKELLTVARSHVRCCRGRERLRSQGWSIYGAQQAQPVAISGKTTWRRNRENKPNPLPSVASGCRLERMVRRGGRPSPGRRAGSGRRRPRTVDCTLAENRGRHVLVR